MLSQNVIISWEFTWEGVVVIVPSHMINFGTLPSKSRDMGAITWQPPLHFYLMTPDASCFGKQANHHIFSWPFPSWGCCCCPSKDTNGLVTPLQHHIATWGSSRDSHPHFLSYVTRDASCFGKQAKHYSLSSPPRCKLFWEASQPSHIFVALPLVRLLLLPF